MIYYSPHDWVRWERGNVNTDWYQFRISILKRSNNNTVFLTDLNNMRYPDYDHWNQESGA